MAEAREMKGNDSPLLSPAYSNFSSKISLKLPQFHITATCAIVANESLKSCKNLATETFPF